MMRTGTFCCHVGGALMASEVLLGTGRGGLAQLKRCMGTQTPRCFGQLGIHVWFW